MVLLVAACLWAPGLQLALAQIGDPFSVNVGLEGLDYLTGVPLRQRILTAHPATLTLSLLFEEEVIQEATFQPTPPQRLPSHPLKALFADSLSSLPEVLEEKVATGAHRLRIHLQRNDHLLSHSYRSYSASERMFNARSKGQTALERLGIDPQASCFYLGTIENRSDSIVSLSTCGNVRGSIFFDGRIWSLLPHYEELQVERTRGADSWFEPRPTERFRFMSVDYQNSETDDDHGYFPLCGHDLDSYKGKVSANHVHLLDSLLTMTSNTKLDEEGSQQGGDFDWDQPFVGTASPPRRRTHLQATQYAEIFLVNDIARYQHYANKPPLQLDGLEPLQVC